MCTELDFKRGEEEGDNDDAADDTVACEIKTVQQFPF
jgi:hypothetical protein